MKIVVAPDSFGNTLTASQAAQQIARGWKKTRPGDQIFLLPQSDGGPGFIEILQHVQNNGADTRHVGDERGLHKVTIDDALTGSRTTHWLLQSGNIPGQRFIACIETALVCGLHQLPHSPNPHTALHTSTYGVGQVVTDIIDYHKIHSSQENRQDKPQIIIGLGGTATNDGGRGFIEALAGKPRDYIYQGDDSSQAHIVERAREVVTLARQYTRDLECVAATDVDNHLLGEHGAIGVFSQQKGANQETKTILEQRNQLWATVLEDITGKNIAEQPGAGAAGGLGAAILAVHGTRYPGADLIHTLTDSAHIYTNTDLVITGEGKFDEQSLSGKVAVAMAHECKKRSIPVIVIAGQVLLSENQYRLHGISKSYCLSEHAGGIKRAMTLAPTICESLASRVARDWNKGLIEL